MTRLKSYTNHCIALNQEEEVRAQRVMKKTGHGLKKIFMAMIDALDEPPVPAPTEQTPAEEAY